MAGRAQVGSGALTGNVQDQAGAAVPGATVTATATRTRVTRTAITGADGRYSIHGLASGFYQVQVDLSGFRPLSRDGVRLATGETVRLDLQLEIGGRDRSDHGHGRRPAAAQRNVGAGARHRQQEGDRPPAQRPQLHHPRQPRARRGAAAGVAACRASTAGGRAPTSTCSTAFRCCNPSRTGRVLSEHRCHSGVQDREQQPACRVRALQWRRRQPDHQVWKQCACAAPPSSSCETRP